MKTTFWRNNYVFITLCVCWELTVHLTDTVTKWCSPFIYVWIYLAAIHVIIHHCNDDYPDKLMDYKQQYSYVYIYIYIYVMCWIILSIPAPHVAIINIPGEWSIYRGYSIMWYIHICIRLLMMYYCQMALAFHQAPNPHCVLPKSLTWMHPACNDTNQMCWCKWSHITHPCHS